VVRGLDTTLNKEPGQISSLPLIRPSAVIVLEVISGSYYMDRRFIDTKHLVIVREDRDNTEPALPNHTNLIIR